MKYATPLLGVGFCLLMSALTAPAVAQIDLNVIIGTPPPPVIVEPMPPPRVGFIWAPGFWAWDGRHHIWQGGHWEAQHVGGFYAQPSWVQAPGGWRFVPGHWEGRGEREHHHHHHDRDDHDGGFCPPGQAKKGNC